MVNLRRGTHFVHFYQIVELHQLAAFASDVKRFQIKRLITVGPVYLANDLILLSIHNEITEAPSAESQLECIGNIKHRNTQFGCFQPVDGHLYFGLIEFQVHIHTLKDGMLVGFFQKQREFFPDFFEVQILQNKLDRKAETTASAHRNGLFLQQKQLAIREFAQLFAQSFCNLLLGFDPFVGVFQYQSNGTGIHRAGPGKGRRDQTHHNPLLRDGIDGKLTHPVHILFKIVVAGSFRHQSRNPEQTPVFNRRQFRREHFSQEENHPKTKNENEPGQPALLHKAFKSPSVFGIHSHKKGFREIVKPGTFVVAFGKQHIQNRCKGKGNKGRNENRTGHYNPEFTEQTSHKPLQEHNWQKHNGQCDGRRNNRKIDFIGTFPGRGFPVFALLHLFKNVFCHHDSVIHHQSRCQDNAQKGQYINTEIHDVHDEESTNQGHRNVNQRTERNHPVTEKEVDNDHHQDEGNHQGFFYFGDGICDEFGFVDRYINHIVLWKFFFDLVVSLVKLFGDLNIVGTRQGNNGETHRVDVVFFDRGFLVFRTQSYVGHIAKADGLSLILAENQFLKIIFCDEPSVTFDGELRGITGNFTSG